MSVKTIYLPELKPLTQSSDAPATAHSRSQQRTDQRVLELTYIEIFRPKVQDLVLAFVNLGFLSSKENGFKIIISFR
jgi:hypothetical protein